MAADCETGEPRLDSETGEERDCSVMGFPALVRCRQAKALQVTVSTDAETGENEWNSSLSPEEMAARRASPSFHIPASLLLPQEFSVASCLLPLLLLLPVLLLWPALAVAVCLISEWCLHCCFHRWEASVRRKPGDRFRSGCPQLSPLHQFVSAFCGPCQATREFVSEHSTPHTRLARLKLKTVPFLAIHRQMASS